MKLDLRPLDSQSQSIMYKDQYKEKFRVCLLNIMCCDTLYADLDDSANMKKRKKKKPLKFAVKTKKGNMAVIMEILGTNKTKELSVGLKVFNFFFEMCYIFVLGNLILIEIQKVLEISSGNPPC